MATKAKETKRKIQPTQIRNAQLIYKNFSGKAKKFNAKGLRNFNVVLDENSAEMLSREGWNIKWDEPREEGDAPRARLKVNVRFDNFPPTIYLVTQKGRSLLDEESVSLLDDADIETVDIKISASTGMTREGKPYVTAYLSRMYVQLDENDLELKWATPTTRRDEDDD